MNTADTSLNHTIDLADFKVRCLEVLEQLVTPGLIVTKEGRPLVRITPVAASTQSEDQQQDAAAFQWINDHASAYHGQWLALAGDRLLAHGANLAEVAAAARAAGVPFPLLHLVEPPREHPYIHD